MPHFHFECRNVSDVFPTFLLASENFQNVTTFNIYELLQHLQHFRNVLGTGYYPVIPGIGVGVGVGVLPIPVM